jgi:hypothetical protein
LWIFLALWYFLGTKKIVVELMRFMVFPFYIVLWYIPKRFFAKGLWLLLLAYFSRVGSFLVNLRWRLLLFTFFITCCVFIFKAENKSVITAGLTGILFFILYVFFFRIRNMFSAESIFPSRVVYYIAQLYDMEAGNNYISKAFAIFPSAERRRSPDGETQIVTDKLNIPLIFFSAFLFLGASLKKMRTRRNYTLYATLKMIGSIVAIIILFSLVNYGIARADASEFNTSQSYGWFDFLFYTFNAVFFHSIFYILPAGVYAKIVSMMIPFTVAALLILFFTSLFVIYKESSQTELEKLIEFSGKQAVRFERIIREQYGMTIKEAMEMIKRTRKKFYNFLANIMKL